MEVNTMDFKEYIGSKKMDVLSKMIDLPYYIVENIEAIRIIVMDNFQEIHKKALNLKDDIETVKRVVEHNKNWDKVDKKLNKLGINLYEIQGSLKNLFNDVHQNIINEIESIRNMYKGIYLEVLDEGKYSRFRAMNPDNYDIYSLMYMISYIKSSKEEAEKIMNEMENKLKDMIEGLFKKGVLNDAILREIKKEEGLSREKILYLENYIINNLYHKGINLNGALKGLLNEIIKVSKDLGMSSVKIDGRNEDILKIIDTIRNYDISQIRTNQNDIKGGMEDSERIYEFFINLDKFMDILGSILIEIYNNGCLRELYGPLENIMEGVRKIKAMMNQGVYDIDGEMVMITNELRRIEGIECVDSSIQKEETKENESGERRKDEVSDEKKDQKIKVIRVEINKNDAKKHFDEGNRLYDSEKYLEAIEEYDIALDIDPNLKEAHNNKGNALHNLGRYDEAIEEYDKALAIDPNDKEAHYNKGITLRHLKRYEEAIKEYDKALAIDPNDKEAHYNKGIALDNLGRYEEAIKEYDKALAIDPNYKEAHNNKGIALDNLGRYEEAIKEYDKALAIDPDYKVAHNNKGYALYNLGRYEEAIKEYDEALAIDPDYKVARDNKELALKELKRFKK